MKWGIFIFYLVYFINKSSSLINKKNSTEKFKVFRIYPRNYNDVDALAEIRKISEEENEVKVLSKKQIKFAD